MAETIWVARLGISPDTANKISRDHGLQADEVRDAVVCVRGLRFVPDDDPKRGRRALVETFIRGVRVMVVLYPANDPLGMRTTPAALSHTMM
jgi:hypothetical protein